MQTFCRCGIESRTYMNPSFFVIGAYRSGTTTLYRLLRQHPEIFLPLEKEPNFFAVDGNPDASDVLRSRAINDRPSYEALYAEAGSRHAGDISPEYLRNPYVASHLAGVVPEAKLIAVLRNPIDRAWSDFLLHRRDGNEPFETLTEALEAQASRTTGGDHRAGHYIDSGMYSEQLSRYFELFAPEQIQVHLFDDLQADPVATTKKIFAHIGVDDAFEVELEAPINASGVPSNPVVAKVLKARSRLRPYVSREVLERVRPAWDRVLSKQLTRPKLGDADRSTLAQIYAEEIPALGELLGRDLGHWIDSHSGESSREAQRHVDQ